MNPNQALWEKGDFTRIAASMRRSGEALVDRLGIAEGIEVLDLGCGWHLIEQHAFVDVAETIEALDLVCSGFRAERTSG